MDKFHENDGTIPDDLADQHNPENLHFIDLTDLSFFNSSFTKEGLETGNQIHP